MPHRLFRKIKAPAGRILFATDVHGEFKLLEKALERANFDDSVDILILGGDNVDRGPYSHLVLEWLKKKSVYSVNGNHEHFCISSARDGMQLVHYNNGGEWFDELSRSERNKFADAFKKLPTAIEVEGKDGRRYGFVHGECVYRDWNHFTKVLQDDSDEWEQFHAKMESSTRRDRFDNNDSSIITGIDMIFVGHSGSERIRRLGNVVYCDGGACFEGGALNLIDVETLRSIKVSYKASPERSTAELKGP